MVLITFGADEVLDSSDESTVLRIALIRLLRFFIFSFGWWDTFVAFAIFGRVATENEDEDIVHSGNLALMPPLLRTEGAPEEAERSFRRVGINSSSILRSLLGSGPVTADVKDVDEDENDDDDNRDLSSI
jgi:hypothetical protein